MKDRGMNAERLLALYERVADAPDAVTRLRRLVLDLAVRGKLVEQDSNDEPQTVATPVSSETAPYVVPWRWQWLRIGDQLHLLNGIAFKPSDWVSDGIKIVRIQNLNNPSAPFNHCVPEKARQRSLIDTGSFLISWSGTPGTSFGAFIWDRGPAVLNQHIFRCDFKTAAFEPRFLKLAINGRLDEMIEKAHGGVGLQHITKGKLEAMLIPLPPIAEQHRIVAKVDELMTLLDRIETARTEREATRNRLTTASLARLTAADTTTETFPTHARFAIDALPALTTRVDQIKALRHTILNLAVQGKLVARLQEEGDGSALASAIRDDREHTKRPAVSPDMTLVEIAVPLHWVWQSLDELIVEGPQNGLSPRKTTNERAPKAITLTATTSGKFDCQHYKRVDCRPADADGYWLEPGDLLFQRGNTREYVGMAAIYDGPTNAFLFPDLIMRVRLSSHMDLRFAHLWCIAPVARHYLSSNAAGAQQSMPKINQGILRALPVAVPPLGEQRRIVARVDVLMALCDRLEAALTTADTTKQRLLQALIHEALTDSASNQEAA